MGGVKYNYKRLLSEKEFLKVHSRALKIRSTGTQLYEVLYDKGRVLFKTRSATDPKNITYIETIDITSCTPDKLRGMRYATVDRLLLESGLKIHCNCPAFHYWGYKYMAWRRGYGIQKETRRPVIRNPYEKGYVCKHLYFVLHVFPMITSQLASKMLRYANGKATGKLKGLEDKEPQGSLSNQRQEEFGLNRNNRYATEQEQTIPTGEEDKRGDGESRP